MNNMPDKQQHLNTLKEMLKQNEGVLKNLQEFGDIWPLVDLQEKELEDLRKNISDLEKELSLK